MNQNNLLKLRASLLKMHWHSKQIHTLLSNYLNKISH